MEIDKQTIYFALIMPLMTVMMCFIMGVQIFLQEKKDEKAKHSKVIFITYHCVLVSLPIICYIFKDKISEFMDLYMYFFVK